MTVRYIKPSGIELDVTDSKVTRDYAESLGWKLKGKEGKRKRRTKEEIAFDEAAKKGNVATESN